MKHFGGKSLKKESFFDTITEGLCDFWIRVQNKSKLDIAILIVGILLAITVFAILTFSVLQAVAGSPVTNDQMDIIATAPSASEVADSGYDQTAAVIDKEVFDGTVLIEGEDAGQDYLDETLFIGDSNTVRMVTLGHAAEENTLAAVSMGIQHVLSSNCMNFQGYGYVSVPTAVELMQPKRIIITYGTNNAYSSPDDFIEWYKDALSYIREAWDYADIIINAVPPVAKTRSYPQITMKTIDEFNLKLAELAKEEGYYFLNSSEALKGDDGYAVPGYMERDGIHLSAEGMDVLMKYISTHPLETEDRRPMPLDDIPKHIQTPDTFFNPPAPSSVQTSASADSSEDVCTNHQWGVTDTMTGIQVCQICGATQQDPTWTAHTHTWGATDQTTGKQTCTGCGATQQDPTWTAPHTHTWGATDQATGKQTCTSCGATQQDPTWTAPHTHTWGATDPNTGTQTCTSCGATQQDPSWTPPHTHTWGATDPNTGVQTCTGCGATQQDPSWTPPHTHTWGATDPNTGVQTCTGCGATQQDPSWTPPVTTPPASTPTAPAA